MAFSKETLFEIWDDASGDHWEIGPDRDALDLIEIRFFDKGSTTPTDRMIFPPEIGEMLAVSISRVGKTIIHKPVPKKKA